MSPQLIQSIFHFDAIMVDQCYSEFVERGRLICPFYWVSSAKKIRLCGHYRKLK